MFERDKRADERKSERAGRPGDEDFHISSRVRGHPRRSLYCVCYLCREIALKMIGSYGDLSLRNPKTRIYLHKTPGGGVCLTEHFSARLFS